MAGNAHANRHGHRADCKDCIQALKNINHQASQTKSPQALANFKKNCRPLQRPQAVAANA